LAATEVNSTNAVQNISQFTCLQNHVACVRLLLDAGAEQDNFSEEERLIPIHAAATV